MTQEIKKISQLCEELAYKLYNAPHNPNRGGPHWDTWDDKREIAAIAKEIEAIAKESWIRGVHAHEIISNTQR